MGEDTYHTDGFAHQYRSATALYFLSLLLRQKKIIMHREIPCAGHGKNIFGGISGDNKSLLMGASIRSCKNANENYSKILSAVKV